jgi:hypothetical protein
MADKARKVNPATSNCFSVRRGQVHKIIEASMNAPEFSKALERNDKRAGCCPFCGEPGWITGDANWCSHYAGTFDIQGAAAPCYPFLAQEPFCKFVAAMIQIARLTAAERAILLESCSPRSRQVVLAALTYPEPLDFWRDYVPHEILFVETGETHCKTTYVSLFVADLDLEKKHLVTTVQRVLHETGFA